MFTNRKAVSPVIATVILVAVAITIAVAVAYWMGGITSSYVKFEKLEITTATCTYIGNPFYAWTVVVNLKNSGTSQVTVLKNVYLNNVEVNAYNATGPIASQAVCDIDSNGLTLNSGASGTMTIWIRGPNNVGSGGYKNLSSGTTVNIRIHSAAGMDYSKMFELT